MTDKTNNFIKIAGIVGFLFLFGYNLSAQTTITNFPFKTDFLGTTIPTGWIKPGTINSATPSTDGLKLTTGALSEFGGVVLDGVDFNSTNGITVSFEYSMYGGNTYDGQYGDGLAFFLFDSNKTSTLGAAGRGLGYSNGDTNLDLGVDGGYIGIGFDEFGNFKDYKLGRNGIPAASLSGPEHLTIRGAMGTSRTNGYPVLSTMRTNIASDATTTLSAKLDITTGNIVYSTTGLSSADVFSIRPGTLSTTVGDTYYRRGKLTLLPRTGGGFRISLEVIHGGVTTVLLNQFEYPTSIKYNDNSASSTATNIVTLNTPVPAKFQLGFAASTGAAAQVHLIRHIEISIPYMPSAADDQISICNAFPQSSTNISPFINDTFYNGPLTGTPSLGNTSSYIDYNSFQFSDVNDNPIGTNQNRSYTENGVGTWTYNATTAQVNFVPVNGFIGQATVYYTAKGLSTNGGPFGQEIYRSAPQKLTVNVVKCGAVVNPQLPAGGIIRSGKN